MSSKCAGAEEPRDPTAEGRPLSGGVGQVVADQAAQILANEVRRGVYR